MRSRPSLWLGLLAIVVALGGALWLLRDDAPGVAAPAGVVSVDGRGAGAPPALPPAAAAPDDDVAPESIDTTRPTTSVAGRVLTADGQAVTGALVQAFLADAGNPMSRRPAAGRAAVTDESGRFTVDELPGPGRIGLEVTHAGWTPAVLEPVATIAGERVDAGDIVLPAGITLRGTVFGPGRAPIEGATVSLVDHTALLPPGLTEPAPARAITGPDGRYELTHLAMRRQYRIAASAEGYATLNTVISFVLTIPDEAWSQDFVLQPAPSLLGGWVLDDGEQPMDGARVTLKRRRRGDNTYFEVSQVTGPDGRFLFDGVPDDAFDLAVDMPGHYLTSRPKLEAGRSDHLVYVLPALVVRGHLVAAGPLPSRFDVRILPDAASGAALLPGTSAARSYDDPREFLVDGLQPGTYHLVVNAPGWAVTRSPSIIIDATTPSVDCTIQLQAGGTIVGRLAGGAGDVAVELHDGSYDPAFSFEGVFPTLPIHGLATRSDARGAFALEHVPEGTYVLSAKPETRPAAHVRDVQVAEGGTTDVGLVTLQPGGSLAGQVLDLDGRPAAGVRVTVAGPDTSRRTLTDGEGRFVLHGLPVGPANVVATPTTFVDAIRMRAEQSVTIAADAEAQVQLMFEERAPVPAGEQG